MTSLASGTAHSVRERLARLGRERGEDFQLTLVRYAIERFLYRLSQSAHRDHVVLKGALLFDLWLDIPHRPTRDIDLGGPANMDEHDVKLLVRDVCAIHEPSDGISYHTATLRTQAIREGASYRGVRARLEAELAGARIPVQIDVGFGDSIVPDPSRERLPTMLDLPAPVLLTYPAETVVAEKLHTIVELGIINSRMKDYLDLYVLATARTFNGDTLVDAIRATFTRRHTTIPEVVPAGLSEQFALDAAKDAQWTSFQHRVLDRDAQRSLTDAVDLIRQFAAPAMHHAVSGARFDAAWSPDRGWQLRT